jgi:Na+/H+ antiporter NhaD/arsenite permease-like protein
MFFTFAACFLIKKVKIMVLFITMIVVFVLGYSLIALEHPIKIDKSATALLLGVSLWVIYVFGRVDILSLVNDSGIHLSQWWVEYLHENHITDPSASDMLGFITHHEIMHHLAEISTILFFLLGAMTIVETVDQHQGFKLITDKIKTLSKVRLLWILSFLTFFMSAALDNLTTTIVLVALLRKLIADKETRWFFASMVILAANAGGAWSPIGDVTTIMLWIGGQVTAGNIIAYVILPSLVTMIVPLIILTFIMKGEVERPKLVNHSENDAFQSTPSQQRLLLIMGILGLLFVPIFKTYTHLPPFMGMLFSLGVVWVTTELIHRNRSFEDRRNFSIVGVLRKVDVPTVFFFLGILLAVASLQSAGHLGVLAGYLDEHLGNIYLINLIIGILSSIVDNVPLVAGAMGMYEIADPGAVGYAANFVVDGKFWEFLAFCAGTGGSILIIGSAAGVAAMGMEKIDFIWYLRKISWLALIGYLAGAATYYVQSMIIG